MPITQQPLGQGRILWLGVNTVRGGFSTPRAALRILEDGIEDDIYRGMWRTVASHDVDYVDTDGIQPGERVLNLRQITIVDRGEVSRASVPAGVAIQPGMLRENMIVDYVSNSGVGFSKLPPLSRMVIGHGFADAKVLLLTEENTPCRTICQPIAAHYGGNVKLAQRVRYGLGGRRGQMAMVRTGNPHIVRCGDTFKVFPPMK